jgi:hypothetical protein
LTVDELHARLSHRPHMLQAGSIAGDNKPAGFTMIRFDWRAPAHLRVASEEWSDRLRRAHGDQDIRIGDEPFDRDFLIQGNTEWARRVLDNETRDLIRKIELMGGSFVARDSLAVDVGPGGMFVRLEFGLVDELEVLQRFVDTAVRLLRRLRTNIREPFEASALGEALRAGDCPICAEAVTAPVARCGRCGTPHHRECWGYAGGCAIYACSSLLLARAEVEPFEKGPGRSDP